MLPIITIIAARPLFNSTFSLRALSSGSGISSPNYPTPYSPSYLEAGSYASSPRAKKAKIWASHAAGVCKKTSKSSRDIREFEVVGW